MAEERIRATDRLSAPAAVCAFGACFAIVASPSFFAGLFLAATESSWQKLSDVGSAPALSMQSSEAAHEVLAADPARRTEPPAARPVDPSLEVAPAVQISAPVPLEAVAAIGIRDDGVIAMHKRSSDPLSLPSRFSQPRQDPAGSVE